MPLIGCMPGTRAGCLSGLRPKQATLLHSDMVWGPFPCVKPHPQVITYNHGHDCVITRGYR